MKGGKTAIPRPFYSEKCQHLICSPIWNPVEGPMCDVGAWVVITTIILVCRILYAHAPTSHISPSTRFQMSRYVNRDFLERCRNLRKDSQNSSCKFNFFLFKYVLRLFFVKIIKILVLNLLFCLKFKL